VTKFVTHCRQFLLNLSFPDHPVFAGRISVDAAKLSAFQASASRMKIIELMRQRPNRHEQLSSLDIGGDTESSKCVNEGEPKFLLVKVRHDFVVTESHTGGRKISLIGLTQIGTAT
jgi:hypothetical protein